jgi:hypothetical protein
MRLSAAVSDKSTGHIPSANKSVKGVKANKSKLELIAGALGAHQVRRD